jgi:YfiH family protein
MEPFLLVETQSLDYFELKPWSVQYPELIVGFSSRNHGTSEAPLHSLNLALHVGDEKESVIANRQHLVNQLEVPFEAWTCAEQVHGKDIYMVTNADRGRGRMDRDDAIPSVDGLLTQEKGIFLTAYYADCVPLYFYDPLKKVIGVAHAGWKGTALQIAEEMVKRMKERFGCDPTQLRAAIGPSIGQCCYEVDTKVIDQIKEGIAPIDSENHPAIIDKENGRFMLDLKEVNRQILLKAGILPYHIELTRRCTSCRTDSFYSHRKENGKTGRMAAWIGLRSE